MEDPIISVTERAIIMKNPLGCRLEILFDGESYRMGSFYYKTTKLGAEANSFINRQADAYIPQKHKRYEIASPMRYSLPNYEIIENTPQKGVIRFYGRNKDLDVSVTIALSRDSYGYSFHYKFKTLREIPYPLYVEVPFHPNGSETLFIQYPFEAPLNADFKGVWDIIPRRSMAPFMFGCKKVEGQKYFMGVGYHLNQEYWKGRLQYDNLSGEGLFRIYTTDTYLIPFQVGGPHWPEHERVYDLHIIVSTAQTQSDCIRGYLDNCGYDLSTPIYRSIEDSIALLISVYKRTPAYCKGKGYHQCIHLDTGEPSKGYGKYVPVCANVALAYQLYKYWLANRSEKWAKERALEIVNFFIKSQNEDGGVPTLWEPMKNRYLTYIEEVRETRRKAGLDTSYLPKGKFLYTTHMLSMAAYYLHRLYTERKKFEGIDEKTWRDSALKATGFLINKIEADGSIGRNYNEEGMYDDICANAWFLIALDYFYQKTGDKKFDEAREKVERWVYKTFAEINHWYNWSADGGWWMGEGPPPINHDAFEIPTFATYCLYRYIRTKEERYLQWAKDVIHYLCLCQIPIQYPEYKHVTKGLIKEQDFYGTYDVPFNTTRLFDCLPYLTVITGDPFYMKLYKLLIQTQLAYQAVDRKYPAFYIGLDWKEVDEYGEKDTAFIVEFAGSMLLESVNSPYAYRYVGGRDWGIGLDYELPFKPNFGPKDPYVIYASSRVLAASWNRENLCLKVVLNGPVGSSGVLGVKWNADLYPIEKTRIQEDSKIVEAKEYFDPSTETLNVKYEFRNNQLLIIKIFVET